MLHIGEDGCHPVDDNTEVRPPVWLNEEACVEIIMGVLAGSWGGSGASILLVAELNKPGRLEDGGELTVHRYLWRGKRVLSP